MTITIEEELAGARKHYRAVCDCGWTSFWRGRERFATEAGDKHTALYCKGVVVEASPEPAAGPQPGEESGAVPGFESQPSPGASGAAATWHGARMIPALAPGSEDWFRYMTASKISAAMGLSTYESKFSLWHRMAGLIPPEPDDDVKRRGHYLEPAIRAWFADQHPEFMVETTGTWVSIERPDQAASPDAIVFHRDPEQDTGCIALAEFKTAHEDEDWGQPGSDDIPVGYRCQVMWQMDTLGVDVCYVAVLNRHLQFVEYVVRYDAAEVQILRDGAAEFMASLRAGERPDIDAHSETYTAIKLLHPSIDGEDVEIDAATAVRYVRAKAAEKAAAAEATYATSLLADVLGTGKRARFGGVTIANRQAKNGGVPYLVIGRNLPDFTELDVAS